VGKEVKIGLMYTLGFREGTEFGLKDGRFEGKKEGSGGGGALLGSEEG